MDAENEEAQQERERAGRGATTASYSLAASPGRRGTTAGTLPGNLVAVATAEVQEEAAAVGLAALPSELAHDVRASARANAGADASALEVRALRAERLLALAEAPSGQRSLLLLEDAEARQIPRTGGALGGSCALGDDSRESRC